MLIRRILLTFAGLVSFPCSAWAGSPYVGVEGGLAFARSSDVDEFVDYTIPPASAPEGGEEFDDVFAIDYDNGYDLGLTGGYDFGWLRLELELAHKQVSLGDVSPDDITDEYLSSVNDALNRPASVPGPGTNLPALTTADFSLDGKMRASSALLNGLIDLKVFDRFYAYGGGGVGRSWVKALGDHDNATAWQWIAGIRYSLSPKLDLGVRYRYFNSGIIKVQNEQVSYPGNPDGGPANELLLTPEIEGEIRTRSFLATLNWNI